MNAEQTAEMLKLMGKLDERTAAIQKAVEGNGVPGLRQRVETLEGNQKKVSGGFVALGTMGSILWGFLEYLFHYGSKLTGGGK